MTTLFILGIIGVVLMAQYIVVCKGFKKAIYNNSQKKDVIIILGYPTRADGKMSPILRERVYKAAKLYKQGISKTIICTGGAIANHHVEADVMAQALIEMGVPENHIIYERFAENTYGNLVLSKKIMEDNGLKTAIIVSSPWHLRKASSYAFKLEINHTIEKSKYPREYFVIGVLIIYLYVYTQMFLNLLRNHKGS